MSYTVTIYTLTATTGEDVQASAKKPFHLPKTGDSVQTVLWGIVLAASAGILICLLILKKRENDGKNE